MANELKRWKYDIQYGPEGEANYAWVYDDRGEMIATMKTHKAKEIVDLMNTRPAAPVDGPDTVEADYLPGCPACGHAGRTGNIICDICTPVTDATGKCGKLETVGAVRQETIDGVALGQIGLIHQVGYDQQPIELVTRSQADAIIAAERARYGELEEIAAGLVERTDRAEADNAALTARVKELEHDLNGAKGNAKNASSNCIYWRGQYEALKAENEKKQTVKWDADGF